MEPVTLPNLDPAGETIPALSEPQPSPEQGPNFLTVVREPNEDLPVALARAVLRPDVQAAATLQEYSGSYGNLELDDLVDSLAEQTRAGSLVDLSRAEAMLTAQAYTLDAIFNHLAQRAVNTSHRNNFHCYLRLGLRAQSQCRATWEALEAIKWPPALGYVHQANIAHGPQQVNNAPVTREGSPCEEESSSIKQTTGGKNGNRLDPGTVGSLGHSDSAAASVGEIDWSENNGR